MHSLAPELRQLQSEDRLDETTASRKIALESGELFSVRRELLLALYASVAALVAGVGLVIRNNLDRIGPLALIAMLAAISAVCYATAIRTALRGESRSLAGDYVLLLGALILSSALGYAESQFHWLGEYWSRHLLLLAALHGATAYLLDSRLLLSAALAAVASWLGIEPRFGGWWDPGSSLFSAGYRALFGAGIAVLALVAHRTLASRRDFTSVYEHFAGNLAFWGAIALCARADTRVIGLVALTALAALASVVGLRRGRESFVVYAIGYAALGTCIVEAQVLHDTLHIAIAGLVTIVITAMLLWRARTRFKAAA
jgi:hypothetical protein